MIDPIHSMDEILELGAGIVKDINDKDLNEAVAKKLGWICDETGTWLKDGIYHHDEPGKNFPDYCHSIEAAWEIWEKLRDQNYDLQLFSSWDRREIVCFNATYKADIGKNFQAECDTAPRAICEAFLRLP